MVEYFVFSSSYFGSNIHFIIWKQACALSSDWIYSCFVSWIWQISSFYNVLKLLQNHNDGNKRQVFLKRNLIFCSNSNSANISVEMQTLSVELCQNIFKPTIAITTTITTITTIIFISFSNPHHPASHRQMKPPLHFGCWVQQIINWLWGFFLIHR